MTLNQTEGSGPVLFEVKGQEVKTLPAYAFKGPDRYGLLWCLNLKGKQTNQCAKLVSTTLGLCYVKEREAQRANTHKTHTYLDWRLYVKRGKRLN